MTQNKVYGYYFDQKKIIQVSNGSSAELIEKEQNDIDMTFSPGDGRH